LWQIGVDKGTTICECPDACGSWTERTEALKIRRQTSGHATINLWASTSYLILPPRFHQSHDLLLQKVMIRSVRNWFKRNRTNFAIGVGVLGAGYLVTQYALAKLTETRQRMSDERIAKEKYVNSTFSWNCVDPALSLRRRFEQNQEDCTFTVLAILPTATDNILDALPVEQVLAELQRQKAERLARSVGPSEVSTADLPSASPSLADDESKSLQSSEYVHASQVAEISSGSDELKLQPSIPSAKSKKSKAQLWNDMKIQCTYHAQTPIH